ncbi:MAG: hypothetical protein K0R65_381 [Crocinitomicaceae bacterium]|jgi:hypothetical protein|nr:hypothetical protein [Crocinitomicaceae bacterium]
MKYSAIPLLFLFFILSSCNAGGEKKKEGVITYSIDYPESKDNFFLYHVLPKELRTSFKDNKMEMKIKKANMENTIIVDSRGKKIASYYNYGEIFTTQLTPDEINMVLASHPKYKITFTNKKDTLLGFDIKQAIAVDPKKPNEKIELWYTDDIDFKNSNWFNGFGEIPGVLMKYSIVQYGLRMEFKATKFEAVTIPDSVVQLKRPGTKISHTLYDKKIMDLFESFK